MFQDNSEGDAVHTLEEVGGLLAENFWVEEVGYIDLEKN